MENTNTGQTGQTEGGKQKGLLAFIKRMLNLGDEAQVERFLDRTVSALSRDVKQAEQNINVLNTQLANMKEDHAGAIEDAKANVRDQYANIDISRIKTNGDQNIYMDEYLKNISTAEKALERLEKEHETLIKQVTDKIEEQQEHIKVRKERIEKIQNFE